MSGLLVAAIMTVLPAAARPRPDGWNLSRFQETAFRDSLMNVLETPGMVILDRDRVRMQKQGGSVVAEVEREWLLLVGTPDELSEFRTVTFDEYRGKKIDEIEAYIISDGKRKQVKASKDETYDCRPYRKHKSWRVEFGDLQAGDILAIRSKTTLEGDNPVYSHAFERELPVLQSDITIEVPTELFEKFGPGWHWWAGSWPRAVSHKAWERPTAWRFRWGERDLGVAPADKQPRSVMTAWTFDELAVQKGIVVQGAGQAAYGERMGYHGPTLSAQALSGMMAGSRHHGEKLGEESLSPTEASYGALDWEFVAQRFADERLKKHVGNIRHLDRSVERIVSGARGDHEKMKLLLADVAGRLETLPAELGTTLYDVHRPVDTNKQDCATSIDKAILLCAMANRAGLRAYPLLVIEDDFVLPRVSLEVFDRVWVVVESPEGRLLADADTGTIVQGEVPAAWTAALTLPACSDETAVLCYGEEAVKELIN